jgi:hypothetical protein
MRLMIMHHERYAMKIHDLNYVKRLIRLMIMRHEPVR